MNSDLEHNGASGAHQREVEKFHEIEKHNDSQLSWFQSLEKDFQFTITVGLKPLIEKLLYLVLIELFGIFIIYAHYPLLDSKNRYITPLVTGALTSLLGQTVTKIFNWIHLCGRMENPSAETSPDLPMVWRHHLKFMSWGGLGGLFTSLWIELLLSLFNEKRYICVLLDQTVGTFTFQMMYVLFSSTWDMEFGLAEPIDWATCIHLCWKLIKLSYMVWPYVSIMCFTLVPPQWIFPINCATGTLFAVVLATVSL